MTLADVSRRSFVTSVISGAVGSTWLSRLAAQAANDPTRKRACILLWMAGGPTQTDTFDPKPDHKHGGPFQAIKTATIGVRIGEHLSRLAKEMKEYAVINSMSTKEGDHGRATLHLRTGNLPQGGIDFPTFGSLVSNERGNIKSDLPGYVSINARGLGTAALSAGFLGSRHAPLVVGGDGGEGELVVQDLGLPSGIGQNRFDERLALLNESDAEFRNTRPGVGTESRASAYSRAARLMTPTAAKAFKLEDEKSDLRDRYGRNRFGQGCLLARRLVERGVPFVEVVLGGWDTHDNNFKQVQTLCQTLDPAWATLTNDLKARGLLDSTMVVWMGEFGRTPVINPRNGRDHFPTAWSVVLGGGGIRGGQVIGKTSADGLTVEDRPVAVPDLLATICLGLGLDPMKQNMSNVARPIRLADPSANPVREVLA